MERSPKYRSSQTETPDEINFKVFIQARMSSRRFPGKMLAPFAGRPLIEWMLDRIGAVVGGGRLVVATSMDRTDDPLTYYVERLGYQVFRGSLENVFFRYQECLREFPTDWIVRICGDSPLLDPGLIGLLAADCLPDVDLVTNVAVRSYPPGQSVEILNAHTLAGIDHTLLDPREKEHPTQFFYRRPERFCIRNRIGTNVDWPHMSFVVDTLDDLRRLESVVVAGELPVFSAGPAA